MAKKRRGSYKDEFVKNFENALVHPSTLRRWRKLGTEGNYKFIGNS